MQYCLEEAGIKIADVAHVGLYWKPWVLRHKAMQALKAAVISRDMFKARVDRGVSSGRRELSGDAQASAADSQTFRSG